MKGKIKKVIRNRGFGFITAEDGTEIFFHRAAISGANFETLEEGNEVEFELEQGPKGPRAAELKTA